MESTQFHQLNRFRQKVIRMVIMEKKSVYETAIACGCTAEKVKRVLKKWRLLSKHTDKEVVTATTAATEE